MFQFRLSNTTLSSRRKLMHTVAVTLGPVGLLSGTRPGLNTSLTQAGISPYREYRSSLRHSLYKERSLRSPKKFFFIFEGFCYLNMKKKIKLLKKMMWEDPLNSLLHTAHNNNYYYYYDTNYCYNNSTNKNFTVYIFLNYLIFLLIKNTKLFKKMFLRLRIFEAL